MATIYSETIGNILRGETILRVTKAGEIYTLSALLPPGMDMYPIVYAQGSLNDCRAAYKAAKAKHSA